jgi:hypothetical protein
MLSSPARSNSGQMLPVRRGVAEAEALGDLEPDGAQPMGLGQLRGHGDAVVGTQAHQVKIGRREDRDATAALRGGGQLAPERVAGRTRVHARQIHHSVDSPLVHEAERVADPVRRDVRVDVDPVQAARGRRIRRRALVVAGGGQDRNRDEREAARRRHRPGRPH